MCCSFYQNFAYKPKPPISLAAPKTTPPLLYVFFFFSPYLFNIVMCRKKLKAKVMTIFIRNLK